MVKFITLKTKKRKILRKIYCVEQIEVQQNFKTVQKQLQMHKENRFEFYGNLCEINNNSRTEQAFNLITNSGGKTNWMKEAGNFGTITNYRRGNSREIFIFGHN